MPIFHDGLRRHSPPAREGGQAVCMYDKMESHERSPQEKEFSLTTNDGRPLSRGELIERIKRGESPTWTVRHGNTRTSPDRLSPKQSPRQSPTPLLPAVDFRDAAVTQQEQPQDNNAAGLAIERPRSALHSGDFRPEKDTPASQEDLSAPPPLAASPAAPWHPAFPTYFAGPRSFEDRPPSRARAVSHSFSNILLMPPTSPLVQAVNNPDLDFSPRYISRSPEPENRRHTFSPQSFQTFQTSCFGTTGSPRPLLSLRREGSFPYQAHQPRRSITSASQLQPNSTPQTPLLRPRRTSTSSEISPLVHAPMVGSYEESILRGRMSTTPSKPLNFIAQIGVLGKGKCKASLRCPPHATVPFPAVFYSYNSGNGRLLDNQPSPYVGLIDLENSLPHPEDGAGDFESKRRKRFASPELMGSDRGEDIASPHASGPEDAHARHLKHRKERLRKRSRSPRAPPGGCYRIPQQGQLQIVIKNPNKTAVKLFLVPYDLSDMEAGTKTFIRQRSYSAGPIIDMPLTSRTNLGTDRPEAALSNSEDPNERPTLRYLIHINICCTGKGRYYLYKSVRVVFANRVPDGKERLRNEIQLPDPRYSTYKAIRDSHSTGSTPAAAHRLSTGAMLTTENAARHSNGSAFSSHRLDDMDGIAPGTLPNLVSPLPWHLRRPHPPGTTLPTPLRPIPFTLSRLEPLPSRPGSRDRERMDAALDGAPEIPESSDLFAKRFPPVRRLGEVEMGWDGGGTPGAAGNGRESPSLLARRLREVSGDGNEVK